MGSLLIIFIFLLSIFHSILFYNLSLGVNVILFTIPLISFLVYALKKNNKVINKKGLLFIIPIVLLSCSYFIYDNSFNKLNFIAIPLLYVLMYIYTIKPTFNLREIGLDITNLLFAPVDSIAPFYKEVKERITSLSSLSNEKGKKLRSILIVIPIAVFVLFLLSKADMMFGDIFKGFFALFYDIAIHELIGRIILFALIFTGLGAATHYILTKYKKPIMTECKLKIENYTIKLLITILNIIYIVFDFIQIRSLLLHHVKSGINYATYARQGFFELMFISVLNLAIILISKKSKDDKYTKCMSMVMLFLTFIIIISSFLRMSMYESAYGYTFLRLLVYVALITEAIMFIPTAFYIINSKVNILKYYIIIVTSAYTLINFVSVDYIIAYNNTKRYYDSNMNSEIDIYYLKNYRADNIPLLIELKDKTNDSSLKHDIELYLKEMEEELESKSLLEYNISKNNAYNKISKR